MGFNNFPFILRCLSRQKFNTALHIVGLTLGMSVCLLIALILRYEWSFDTWHKKADRIYRINSIWSNSGKKNYSYSTPIPMAEALRSTVPGLEKVALAHPVWNNMVEINSQKRFRQERILVAGPELLDVFDFLVLRGDGRDALKKPYQALLTETTAKKFFGKADPIGKVFIYKNLINGNNSEFRITVAGLIQDLPSNTHLPASMLLSYVPDQNFLSNNPDSWTDNSNTSTYVVLPSKFNQKNLEAQLKKLADKNINGGKGLSQHERTDFNIQPLRTIHFDTKYAAGSAWVKAVDSSWLWFFACIGIAVLLLACINFINLSTAQALTRAKEVGVRKTVGAGKFHLITQFLGEAWIIAFIAGILSIVIAKASIPAINNLLDKEIIFHPFQSPGFLVVFLPAILFTGVMAGLYPAWIIAKFNPVAILKTGSITMGAQGSSWLRKVLVVTQFTISAGLLITVLLIAQQVNYMRYNNLGFNRENILNVEISDSHKAPAFASELGKIPQIKDFSFATATPSNNGHWGSDMSATNENGPDRQPVTLLMGDHHFCSMYGLRLLSGRFPEAADTNYVSNSVPGKKQIIKSVVNEKLLKALGLGSPEAAVGKRFWVGMNSGNVEIIGVVADFNLYSLHYAIPPTLISQLAVVYNQAGIKIEAGSDLPRTIAAIERAWKKAFPDGVFAFQFLDEQIDAYYKSEIRLYTLFKIFAGLAMFISCLGLWGLTAFAAQQRTKEIGIRKVLGASVAGIVTLLSKDFLKLVGLALIIASPVAWYFMHQWFQDFAFRIDISGWIFMVAGIIVLAIALITVGFLAIKAAMANPVESLRTE